MTLFPRRLQNTAISPTLLPKDDYAREIINIIPNTNKAGSGAKRFGVGAKGSEVAGTTIKDGPFEFRKSDGTIQLLVYCANGALKAFDEDAGTYSDVKTGLTTTGTIGSLPFNNKLIFWNGIDRCFSWDGATATDLGEWVEDVLMANPTQVDTNTITLEPEPGRADYANGTQVRVTFETAGAVTGTVASTSGTTTLTINVGGTPFPNPNQTITKVEYFGYPPAFSFMFAEHDMLWGLTPGELRARRFRGNDGMKVYFQAALNNENSWFDYAGDEPTQDVPFINLSNKIKKFDELVAISSLDGNLCFHGRSHLIIYTGNNPLAAGEFVWVKTMPVGTLHQKLVQPFPGDVLFVTPYGARSLRKVFQTEAAEVVADLGSDIDPTIQAKVATLLAGDDEYKKARSFYYDRDGLYGFKLDDEGLLIYLLSEESKGWVTFTGHFADASGFCGTTDGRLLLTRGAQLHAYANGTDADAGEAFSDDDEAIACSWWMPWLQAAGGRWGNRMFEILVEQTASGIITIERFINYNERNVVTTQVEIEAMGAEWDESMFDEPEDPWDGAVTNPVVEDKFLADNFACRLSHADTEGPRSILGIRPIGR
ncbi:hypothetical protein [Bradyrhizobium sp.]|uniref:hypothetical protein n=1 Tax=Bradyrhizobium sp. TaxID=376 RepID=UPI002736755C|nr:hypothetical protein [Bradyrhizobium sp.]MDP3078685.1 hypothetical protein [Bradyrhizobium sp.]